MFVPLSKVTLTQYSLCSLRQKRPALMRPVEGNGEHLGLVHPADACIIIYPPPPQLLWACGSAASKLTRDCRAPIGSSSGRSPLCSDVRSQTKLATGNVHVGYREIKPAAACTAPLWRLDRAWHTIAQGNEQRAMPRAKDETTNQCECQGPDTNRMSPTRSPRRSSECRHRVSEMDDARPTVDSRTFVLAVLYL